LLAGLLCWLDARARGAQLLLRIEDVDTARCTPEFADDMLRALEWLGLDWDATAKQSSRRAAHEAALDALAARELLYPCSCSRSRVRSAGRRAADGGWRYPGHCRERALPAGGWRDAGEPLRLRLPAGRIACTDAGGLPLLDDPADALGDPVLLRRDGAIAYHLAVVVDDAHDAIDHVVRGRDLAPLTAIHRVLQNALGFATPTYRHHFLLLERSGRKLAKLHGAIGWEQLAEVLSGADVCGQLAFAAGLLDAPVEITPRDLLPEFSWSRVRREDQLALWSGSELSFSDVAPYAVR
jgi:glutamyl-tRNA synthetase/glutamyl-Q tRNA(Asp) synthetase